MIDLLYCITKADIVHNRWSFLCPSGFSQELNLM